MVLVQKFLTVILLMLVVLLFACQPEIVKKEKLGSKEASVDLPEDIWLSSAVHTKIDTVFNLFKEAGKKIEQKDTLGAEIYFNRAFELVSQFSEHDRTTLQFWSQFDTVFKKMNEEYEKIYISNNITMEAEEVRQDISDFEDRTFPDSVLFGEGTVIDSSGDLPITINRRVRLALKYFQTKGRVVFTKWLERSGRYEDLIGKIISEKELPEDLLYVAMIESGFNPAARSYARAVGMWQFISATGRYYGLRNNWWFDERRDVLKSTRAALSHFSDLHDRFGDWYLALAGYNCNPRKVDYNMRRYQTHDFWKLKRLPRQTRNYIPTFLAAAIIAKNPEKFGFFVEKQKPIQIDTVLISESLDLNVIANLVDTTYTYIKEINPAVLRWVTPPGIKNFTLYLPWDKKEQFKNGYAKIPDNKKRSWVRHRIKSGEALSTIAQKYHTSISVIKSTNHLRSNRIRAGNYLLIPVPQNKKHYYTYTPPKTYKRKKPQIVKNVPGHKKTIYLVKPGDTLGGIAEDFKTRANKIRQWNGLRYGRHIYPKQKLVIWIPETLDDMKAQVNKQVKLKNEKPRSYYLVKRGDTLWDISKKYNISIRELKKINNMRSSSIRPGDKIKISSN